MKFIRDIIADKREQVHPDLHHADENRPDTDVMASVLNQSSPEADALHLGDEYMIPEDSGPAAAAEFPPAQPEAVAQSFEAQPPLQDDNLNDWEIDTDVEDIDLSGITQDVFEDSAVSQTVASFFEDNSQQEIEETGVQNQPEADVSDLDLTQYAEPDTPAEDPLAERPYKLFRRSMNQTPEPEVEQQDEPQTNHQDRPASEAQQPMAARSAVPPVPPQHPAPMAPAPVDRQPTAEMPSPVAQPAPPPQRPATEAAAPIDVPSPAMGRGSSRAGRVKTRLLGFSPGQAVGADPFARNTEKPNAEYTQYPVGWLAVVKGPGRGAAFTLYSGVTIIGRGEDQTVRLDFGDNSISRANHAAIAFDAEQNSFFIGHGGKANLVRLNNRPVLSTEELGNGDLIRIGETTLRFVPLCGSDFGWNDAQQGDAGHAS